MIYRVARNIGDVFIAAAATSRAPGNIPYYVDNIWEWLRPNSSASRRKAAFASPTPELAALCAQGNIADAWRVELAGGQPAYQIVSGETPHDARYHADVNKLKSIVVKECLGQSWYDLPLKEKSAEIGLFAPCISKFEVQEIFNNSQKLDEERVRNACTFWQDIEMFYPLRSAPHLSGEIFFEGAYRLYKVQKE